MFFQKRQSFQINPDDPVFHAVYLGKMEIPSATQPSSVISAVQTLWERAHKVGPEKLPRVSMTLGPRGISLEDKRPNTKYQFQFSIGRISYCMANKGFKCVFAWVVAQPRTSDSNGIERCEVNEVVNHAASDDNKKPRCHAVVCEREDIARAMALLMTAYFNSAFHNHKTKEKRETRKQITKERISELEGQGSSDGIPSLSPQRSASRQSSTRSRMSNGEDRVSPIHAMVAKAFGMSPKELSQPDVEAMHATEEKLKSLQVDHGNMSERGELEAHHNWVSDDDGYAFF